MSAGVPPPAPEAWRYERKFFVTALSLPQVECLVRLHPIRFSPAWPPRHVNNLYLDSIDRRCRRDAVAGLALRYKVRARWYGDLFGDVESPQLELKLKRGTLGSKRSFPLEPLRVARRERLGLRRAIAAAPLPDDVRARVAGLRLALLNRYRRRYYASPDRVLRLTVDTDQAFYAVGEGRNSYLRAAFDRDSTIVELKYASDADDIGRWAASRFPFRITRSSKYVRGLELLRD